MSNIGHRSRRLWELGLCFVCGSRGEEKVWEIWEGSYHSHGEKFYFHNKCLKKVLDNPERYSTETLDSGLKVEELISRVKNDTQTAILQETKRRKDLIAAYYAKKNRRG